MTTALAEREPIAPAVTSEQLDLIKRTVASGATPDELKLYLFDCARQGVHPLDKLIHFTVRKDKQGQRKYTPVTSIDFMRIRAADSGEMAGSDDPVFVGDGDDVFSATVTVYRLTQGQRFAYTATARWSEYKPDQDFMWRKMPHTMLGKCAEALALRKGFPRQLAGLYAKEEMEQADNPKGFVVEAPATPVSPAAVTRSPAPVDQAIDAELGPSRPNGPDSGDLPSGTVLITKVEGASGKAKGFIHHSDQPVSRQGGDGIAIYDDKLVSLAAEVCQAREPVTLELKTAASGKPYVKAIKRMATPPSDAEIDAEIARAELARQAGEIA